MHAEAARVEAETSGAIMRTAGRIGAGIRGEWDEIRHTAAVIGTTFSAAIRPGSWTPAVRMSLARQMHANAIEPLWFVASIGVFVGISVVVQLTFGGRRPGAMVRRSHLGRDAVADDGEGWLGAEPRRHPSTWRHGNAQLRGGADAIRAFVSCRRCGAHRAADGR
jgi:hypothetical protein